MRIDGAKLAECLDSLKVSCEEWLTTNGPLENDICSEVLVGQASMGNYCIDDRECADLGRAVNRIEQSARARVPVTVHARCRAPKGAPVPAISASAVPTNIAIRVRIPALPARLRGMDALS